MTHRIELTKGRSAIIDDEDLALVSQYKWSFNGAYICTFVQEAGKTRTIYLHRLIMCAPEGLEVDHINLDKLDNRRANLRLATRSQNAQNRRGAARGSSTGVRGVFIQKGLYRVRIWVNQRAIHLGYYKTLEEADRVAREGRRRYMTHSRECEAS